MIDPAQEGQTGGILGAGFQTEQPAAQPPHSPSQDSQDGSCLGKLVVMVKARG